MRRSVRSRVWALIIVPLLAASVLGGLVFNNARNDAAAAQRSEDLARIVADGVALSKLIQEERDMQGLMLAGATDKATVDTVRERADEAVARFSATVNDTDLSEMPPGVQQLVRDAQREVSSINFYRQSAAANLPYDDIVVQDYEKLLRSLAALIQTPAAGTRDSELTDNVSVLDKLARAAQATSLERGYLAWALGTSDEINSKQRSDVRVAQQTQELFLTQATVGLEGAAQIELRNGLEETREGIELVRRKVESSNTPDVLAKQWYDAATARLDILHASEDQLVDQIVSETSSAAVQARTTAIVTLAALGLALLGTFLLAAMVARSIVTPLRRLRSAALESAERGLPSIVERIKDEGPRVVRETGEAITAESDDEIGEVAEAFNAVHGTAVRIAGEQALLRQNLDSIVVNLSRRTQSLIDRQLREIEDLEARERDPEQLGTLFRIDHLATRVRRHAESLLVLAGVEAMRRAPEPVPILDVVRAAVGEVEQYPRVRFGVLPTDLVNAAAVDDVAHLLAELIDNATEFSPPSTSVTVSTQPLRGGGLRVSVADEGLGIPGAELAELNSRLTSHTDIDVAASRTLGLYVVARLAARHGIRVRLVARPEGGTTAEVDLPPGLVVSPLDVDSMDGRIPAVTDQTDDGHKATVHPHPALARAQQGAPLPSGPQAPSAPPRRQPQPSAPDHGGLPRRSPSQPSERPAPPRPAAQAPAGPHARDGAPGPLPRRGGTGDGAPPLPRRGEQPPAAQPDGARPAPPSRGEQPAPGGLPRRGEQPPPGGLPRRGEQPAASLPPRGEIRPGDQPPRPTEPAEAAGLPRRGQQPPAARADQPNGGLPQRGSTPRPTMPGRPDTTPGSPLAPVARKMPQPPSDDDLPIFNAVRSSWFRRGGTTMPWTSPADEGWRRAEAAARAAEAASLAAQFAARDLRVGATSPEGRPDTGAASRPTHPARPAPTARPEPWTKGGQAGPLGGDRPATAAPAAPTPAARTAPAAAGQRPAPAAPAAAQPGRQAPAAQAPAPDSGAGSGLPRRGPADAPAPRPRPGGLPTRQRGATLVPGAIQAERKVDAARDAKTVRSTLSTLQRGVSRGRDAARTGDTGGWIPTKPDSDERSNT